MAAPNIVNVVTITGKTGLSNVTTTASAIVNNTAASGKVFKVNTLMVSNIDASNVASITANVVRSSLTYALASTIAIPSGATLVIVSKDAPIYLEEGDQIQLTATVDGDLQGICSYEEIS